MSLLEPTLEIVVNTKQHTFYVVNTVDGAVVNVAASIKDAEEFVRNNIQSEQSRIQQEYGYALD